MDSSCAEAYFQLGLHVEGDGRLEEARELLEQGLRLVERQPILTILGSVQRRLHDSTAAKLSLTRAIELDSLDAEASYGLGLVFADTDPAEAILHLRRALEIDPNVPHANTELGFALFALRRFEEAGAALRLAVAQNPSDAWAHEELGHVLGRSGEWALAKDEYEHATALEPRNGLFWCHLADSCFQLGKSSEADEHYKRALELGLDDAYSYARYANFLRATGRLTTAKQYFRRALQLDSSIRQAKNALAELEADEA